MQCGSVMQFVASGRDQKRVDALRAALRDNPCYIGESGTRRYFSDDDLWRAILAADAAVERGPCRGNEMP